MSGAAKMSWCFEREWRKSGLSWLAHVLLYGGNLAGLVKVDHQFH